MEVLIIGAGIGGLTLGLMLHRAGIACRIFEAAPELKAVGVGINILPHASRELCALGLEEPLAKVAVTTREYCFYNRFGQFIYSEPAGRFAGYDVLVSLALAGLAAWGALASLARSKRSD